MNIVDLNLNRVDWQSIRTGSSLNMSVPDAIRELLRSKTPDDAEQAYWKLENNIVVQGRVYQSAEYAIPALLCAFLDPLPRHTRIAILDLFFQVLSGEPHPSELVVGNFRLMDKCVQRTQEGLWLLYKEFWIGERDAALDVLKLIDADQPRLKSLTNATL